MKKRISLLLVVALVFVMTFTGCTDEKVNDGGNGTSDNVKKDSIVIGGKLEAINLDPQKNGDIMSQRVSCNIFETLIRDNDGEYVPAAAETWEISEDGMEYTFYLSKGNKFHNGVELKASDVKYTYDRAADSPFTAELVECVKSIDIVDEYTVKITLLYPYVPILSLMSCPQLGIVCEEAAEAAGDSYSRNPIGSGPYKFVKWNSGQDILLEAYGDYHLESAPIKNLTWKVISDPSTALIALEKGEIDAYVNVANIDKQRVIDNDNLDYYERNALYIEYYEFNCQKEPFDNPLVRQAVAYAIDQEGVLDGAMEGNGTIAENSICPEAFGYTDKVKRYPHDIEKAKELLAEAGYPDGFTCTIVTVAGKRKKEAEIAQANLAEIGIQAEVQVVEWGTCYDLAAKGEFDIAVLGWGYLAPDADQGLYAKFHSSQMGASKFNRYLNSELDEALKTGRTSPDQAIRAEAYEEVTQILHDEVPFLPMYFNVVNIACDDNLKGVKPLSMQFYFIADWSW